MKALVVKLEHMGVMIPIGSIRGDDAASSCFCYAGDYLQNPAAVPVSLSLPLQAEPFTPAQTRNFFEGLLPEGFTRRTVAQWLRADESDYLTLLHGLGRECLGALCITDDGTEPEASYERITQQQIRELAAEGVTKSAELVTKSHLSLTGASGKVGLYYDSSRDEWYLPWGTAPSTHIVKQSHIRLDGIVTNEQLSLQTAARCGIEVSPSFIIDTGSGEENEVLFATQRYDRRFSADRDYIGGLPRPMRLHQEDFGQAMGLPASRKYEKTPSGYLHGMFDILRKYSAEPIADQLKLWDIVVFNYLIGNTDSHVKNFSLLYAPDLKSVRLAPAYDIVSTTVYEQSTRDMAFYIGGTLSMDDISKDAYRLAAREVGLGERMAMERYDAMCGRFRQALHASAEELAAAGYPKAEEMEARILQSGGIRAAC